MSDVVATGCDDWGALSCEDASSEMGDVAARAGDEREDVLIVRGAP